MAGDILGEGDEVSGRNVAVGELGGVGPEQGEERLVADLVTEVGEEQPAQLVDATVEQVGRGWEAGWSRASVIDDHRWGFADNDDSSRKIRSARRFPHGLANRCNPACNRGANRSSAACEYEMKPS